MVPEGEEKLLPIFSPKEVNRLPSALRALTIVKVVAELGSQGSFNQRLFERHRSILNSFGNHRSADELVDQLLGNGWKVTWGLTGQFLFAGIHASLQHVMPEHNIYDCPHKP